MIDEYIIDQDSYYKNLDEIPFRDREARNFADSVLYSAERAKSDSKTSISPVMSR